MKKSKLNVLVNHYYHLCLFLILILLPLKVNHIYSTEAQENSPANSHLPFLWATSGPPESP